MKSKQLIGIGLLTGFTLLYILVFNYVSHRPQKKITEIYFADRVSEAHRILIEKYNVRHANSVKIVPIDFPPEDFSTDARKEVLARSLRGEDDAIDLLAVDVIWVHRFAKWCEPLGKYFTAAERDKIAGNALQTCYHEGELVAIPLDLVQGVMYYREDLLQQLPGGKQVLKKIGRGLTWQQFLHLHKSVNGYNPYYIFPASEYEGFICSYIEILLSLQPNYFESIGFRFDTPVAKKALQLLVDLIHTYKVTPQIVSSFTEVSSYQYFIRNNGLFIRGWTSYDKDFKNDVVDSIKESHLRKAPIPYLAEGKPSYLFGGWHLMMSKASTKKEAVIDFMKYLLSDEAQEIFYTKGGFYPIINSFYRDSTYLRRYPEIIQMKELMRHGVHRPLQENYTKYSKIMARYFYLSIIGKMSVDDALRNVDAMIKAEGSQTGKK